MIQLTETATRLILQGEMRELRQLDDALKYRPPYYFRSDAYQLWKMTGGQRGWDGYLRPLRITPRGQGAGEAISMRGHLDLIQEHADRLGLEVQLKLLPRPFQNLVPDDLPDDLIKASFELDEAQRECIANWLRETIGVNHMSVNSGKTACFAAAASFIKRAYPRARVLYVTQSERLVRQAFSNMTEFLPGWSISQFGGGEKDSSGRDMVVATAAMLGRNFSQLKASKWLQSFMVVENDESHHASSPTLEKVLLAMPAVFRFGASDTIAEGDIVRGMKIQGLLGPVLDRQVLFGELASSGRSATPHVSVVTIPEWAGKYAALRHAAEEGSPAWTLLNGEWKSGTYMGPAVEADGSAPDGIKRNAAGEPVTIPNRHRIVLTGEADERELDSRWCLLERLYDRAIIRFKDRNEQIARWAKLYSGRGWPTLVVCTRTLHIYILRELIQRVIGAEKVQILYSAHSSKERDVAFQWLRQVPGAVLITPLAKEGVSIPEIRAGIVADHVVNLEVLEQIIGRFVRKKEAGTDNEAHVTVFMDNQHPTYRAGSSKILKGLNGIVGYKVTPVSGLA
jgi:superfamily II DNA or RNA helicase